MRFLIWTWRVVLVVVVGAFVATLYYVTRDAGEHIKGAIPTLSLITVIGPALLGIVWAVTRRYWHAFILLVALGLLRGLFGFPNATEPELITNWQADFLWVPIGVIALALVVALTVRAVLSERALKTVKAGRVPAPAQAGTAVKEVTAAEAVAPPAVAVAPDDAAQTERIPAPDAGKES